jgi:hypothetical protein
MCHIAAIWHTLPNLITPGAEQVFQQGYIFGLCLCPVGRLDDHRRSRGRHDLTKQAGIYLTFNEVVVPIAAGIELILGIVGMNQIYGPGYGPHPGNHGEKLLATGVSVTGIQTNARPILAYRIPEPSELVQTSGHSVFAAGGVLDEDPTTESALSLRILESLTPVCYTQCRVVLDGQMAAVHHDTAGPDLAGGYHVCTQQGARWGANFIVRRGHIDEIWGVDYDLDIAVPQGAGIFSRLGLRPALWAGEKKLRNIGAAGSGFVQRSRRINMGTYTHVA